MKPLQHGKGMESWKSIVSIVTILNDFVWILLIDAMDRAGRADIFSSPEDEPLAETAVSVLQKIQQRHAKMPMKKASNLAEEAQEDLILLSDTSVGSTGRGTGAPRWCRHKRGKASDTTQGAEIAPKVSSDTVDTGATVGSFGLSKETDMLALELCAQAELRLIWEDCKLEQKRAEQAEPADMQHLKSFRPGTRSFDFHEVWPSLLLKPWEKMEHVCFVAWDKDIERFAARDNSAAVWMPFVKSFQIFSGPRWKSREVEDNFERTRHEAGVRSEFLEHTKLGLMMGVWGFHVRTWPSIF